jgi:hypothetical protein
MVLTDEDGRTTATATTIASMQSTMSRKTMTMKESRRPQRAVNNNGASSTIFKVLSLLDYSLISTKYIALGDLREIGRASGRAYNVELNERRTDV